MQPSLLPCADLFDQPPRHPVLTCLTNLHSSCVVDLSDRCTLLLCWSVWSAYTHPVDSSSLSRCIESVFFSAKKKFIHGRTFVAWNFFNTQWLLRDGRRDCTLGCCLCLFTPNYHNILFVFCFLFRSLQHQPDILQCLCFNTVKTGTFSACWVSTILPQSTELWHGALTCVCDLFARVHTRGTSVFF